MKSLIIAVLLSLATPALATPVSTQITSEQFFQRVAHQEKLCAALISGKVTSEEIIKNENLNTQDKRIDFALHCMILKDAFEAGRDSALTTVASSVKGK